MGLFEMGWPLIGLGGAIVIIILLFASNTLRFDLNISRWWDPVWLAWILVPIYLTHQFEEYTLHSDFFSGVYSIVETFNSNPNTAAIAENIPLAHFPVMNITFVWIAVPLAAFLCKRNPIVGLSCYGFVLVNGFIHAMSSIVGQINLFDNPGSVTGALIFLPITAWMIFVCTKSNFMTGKGLSITLISGVIGHIGLFSVYILAQTAGAAGVLIGDVVVSFLPLIVAYILSKIFNLDHSLVLVKKAA